jgi:hypothetical protein
MHVAQDTVQWLAFVLILQCSELCGALFTC